MFTLPIIQRTFLLYRKILWNKDWEKNLNFFFFLRKVSTVQFRVALNSLYSACCPQISGHPPLSDSRQLRVLCAPACWKGYIFTICHSQFTHVSFLRLGGTYFKPYILYTSQNGHRSIQQVCVEGLYPICFCPC